MLLIKQAYLVRKIRYSPIDFSYLKELFSTRTLINEWYSEQSKKVQKQSRRDEYQESERTCIYHHEIHRKQIKKGSILKLETKNGIIKGHDMCASYLEEKVKDLLCYPAQLDVMPRRLC